MFNFTSILSANDNDDGFFTVVPEDYYSFEDNGDESKVANKENNTFNQNPLQAPPPTTTTTTLKKQSFNIAVTADWGCEKDTKKTVENIQKKNPELVIAAGDLSYHKSSECWFDIIKPFKSK